MRSCGSTAGSFTASRFRRGTRSTSRFHRAADRDEQGRLNPACPQSQSPLPCPQRQRLSFWGGGESTGWRGGSRRRPSTVARRSSPSSRARARSSSRPSRPRWRATTARATEVLLSSSHGAGTPKARQPTDAAGRPLSRTAPSGGASSFRTATTPSSPRIGVLRPVDDQPLTASERAAETLSFSGSEPRSGWGRPSDAPDPSECASRALGRARRGCSEGGKPPPSGTLNFRTSVPST